MVEKERKFGLLGYPVAHSLSPAMHSAAFRALGLPYTYSLLPTPPEGFASVVEQCIAERFAGWNITVPHKQRMMLLLDEASSEVHGIGACNTVRVENGKLLGYNTDPLGFMRGLQEAGGVSEGCHAVVLGAGGGSRAVVWALASAGHSVRVLARKPEQAEDLASSLAPYMKVKPTASGLDDKSLARALDGAELLVNCTPQGQHPNTEQSPLPEGVRLPEGILVYDLVYNPRPTRLLADAAQSGCRTQDGLAMLLHQGAAAFEIWTGIPAPVQVMRDALEASSTAKAVLT